MTEGPEPESAGEESDDDRRLRDKSVSLSGPTTSEFKKKALEAEERNARRGLAIGLVLCVIGAVLAVFGFTGAVDITFNSGSSSGHLATGSIGVVFAIIGLAIIWITRFNVDA